MNKINLTNYNLQTTLLGGQSFSWKLIGDTYYGVTQDKIIKLKQNGNELFWQTYPQKDNFEFLKNYLRLDVNYDEILNKVNKDKHTAKAIQSYQGLRLLNQDFEQTLLSFIISSFNNIKKIRFSIDKLSRKFGEKIKVDDKEFFLFPQAEVLAEAKIDDLLETSIGYRAKYLKMATEKLVLDGRDALQCVSTENDFRKYLKSFYGIGDKVADCIMVFSLNFDNITPMDVWGKRVLTDLYGLDKKMKYDEMRNWVNDYFEGYGAWAGQFLFEWIRNEK